MVACADHVDWQSGYSYCASDVQQTLTTLACICRDQTNYVSGSDWTNRDCSVFATRGVKRLQHKRRPAENLCYRFSAFWLRSSRNNCSLEFNSSNGGIAPKLLIQFLRIGTRNEACFARPTGCPGIAVPPGAAHSPFLGGYNFHKKREETRVTVYTILQT